MSAYLRHRRLPSGFARGTGACPMGLQEARALAQQVCKKYGRLLNKLHDARALA
ncbi:hypothetical protein CRG98_023137 [Punica granatum]|uniref:Uncharacterized protein n=1 Tax=Punica granatum TaxID=22663 RepID=A0A2I0JJR2_PUNGR|nr:hypothetical protein CRG98_023137 [Punica granatum]